MGCLAQDGHGLDLDGQLPGAGVEDGALHTHEVAEVEEVEYQPGALSKIGPGEVGLQPSAVVEDIEEDDLPHLTASKNAAGDPHAGDVPCQGVRAPADLGQGMGRMIGSLRVRIDA